MGRRQAQLKRLWLRNHGSVEDGLQEAVQEFFAGQADTIADAIAEHGTANETTVDQIFRPVDWNDKLIVVVKPHLLRAAAMGAGVEYQLAGVSTKKSSDVSVSLSDDSADGEDLDLSIDIPPEVMKAIRQQLKTTLDQPYWLGIQDTTRQRLQTIFADAATNGDSLKQIADAVRKKLGRSKARSLSLARTETTGMMNAGHYQARAELIDQGYVAGSEWVATEDGRTRPVHSALDGKIVGKGHQFDVGGEQAPYPGYYGLSARQRVHCRCTTVASVTLD